MFTRNFYYAIHHDAGWENGRLAHSEIADGTTSYTFTNGTHQISRYSSSTNYTISYHPQSYYFPGSTNIYSYARFPTRINGQGTETSGLYGCGVLFGTGTTAPTIDDYTLSGNVITNCVCSASCSRTLSDDLSTQQWQTLFTITNNNEEAITIGELGVFLEIYVKLSSTMYNHEGIMLDRTLLENPITIEPGGVGQITANWALQLPVFA